MTPTELNLRLTHCVGRSIESVGYHQTDVDDPAIHDIHPEIGDFCDFGVSLHFDDQTVAYVAWDGTFCQYGLMLTRCAAADFESEGRVLSRTRHVPWRVLIDKRITATEVLWSEFDHSTYPQAFLFDFGNGDRMLFSAAQPMDRPDGSIELFGISDWVAILYHPRVIDEHLRQLRRGG